MLAGSSRTARWKPETSGPSRTDLVLKKLRTAKGASIAQLTETTGWQAHSVRGFLSGTVKKKLGLNLVNEVGKDGSRRYRVTADADGARIHPIIQPSPIENCGLRKRRRETLDPKGVQNRECASLTAEPAATRSAKSRK